MSSSKPTPRPGPLTEPFWAAAGEHRLVVQRCSPCGYFNHPPRPLCDRCSSEDLSFSQVSGRGRIYSYTVMRQKTVAGFAEEVPYLTAVVELEEQPNLFMITNLPGARPGEVALDQPVEVQFEQLDDDIVLPQFRLATGISSGQ
jgi:uncharacterized OB-fold protein